MSYYLEIAEDIKERIIQGEFNKLLPTHEELAAEYQTSRVTISRAIQLLKIEGWVSTDRRNGTAIHKRKVEKFAFETPIDHYAGGTAYYGARGNLQTEVIAFAILPAEEYEAESLQLAEGGLVYDMIRLRSVDGKPMVLEYTVMPVNLFPDLTKKALQSSLYQYIQKDLCLKIGPATRRIRADKADVYDQKYLTCEKDTPILEIDQVVFLEDGTPFELSQSRYPYDVTEFTYTTLNN